jgi:hypothetical protein
MEYWSVEKKDIDPLAITPTLQCSRTPKYFRICFGFVIKNRQLPKHGHCMRLASLAKIPSGLKETS